MAGHRVCPWWFGYLLASPIRRLAEDPAKILSPYVRQGMTVLEPGPGMGFFTLTAARLVGGNGRVVAVDVQPRMIERLRKRAAKAAVLERLDLRVCAAESMGVADLAGRVDFVLAFGVVHEMPAASRFFAEAAAALKPGGLLLLAEPKGHVSSAEFDAELAAAAAAGFALAARPPGPGSMSALLSKT